jgi:organic hydroperoxide reductase OsmC/OhrA
VADFSVSFRTIPDTNAAVGRAGAHTVVIDRPDGVAGGMGLGFNGGQLLAIAIGGCLCNDLQYAARKLGIVILNLAVDVSVAISGDPLIAESADVRIAVTAEDADADIDGLIAEATRITAVGNSVQRGFPVSFTRQQDAV